MKGENWAKAKIRFVPKRTTTSITRVAGDEESLISWAKSSRNWDALSSSHFPAFGVKVMMFYGTSSPRRVKKFAKLFCW